MVNYYTQFKMTLLGKLIPLDVSRGMTLLRSLELECVFANKN